MTDARGLWQAILDDPDDVGLRLVYADLLEEQGDPRAEFIRVQCALEELGEHDEARPELEAREQQLLATHLKEWLGPLLDLGSRYDFAFRRGFVEHVAMTAGQFLRHAQALCRLAPVRHLSLVEVSDARLAADLANCPQVARLRRLDLYCSQLRERGWKKLFGSPHLTRLAVLDLTASQVGVAFRDLVRSPLLAPVRALKLQAGGLGAAE